MNHNAAPQGQAPAEPVLEMDDIQGIAIPGFFKQHQTLLYLTVPAGSREVIGHFKRWIAEFANQASSASRTLQDRRDHRKSAAQAKGKRTRKDGILLAIAFSSVGLRKLTPGAADI